MRLQLPMCTCSRYRVRTAVLARPGCAGCHSAAADRYPAASAALACSCWWRLALSSGGIMQDTVQ